MVHGETGTAAEREGFSINVFDHPLEWPILALLVRFLAADSRKSTGTDEANTRLSPFIFILFLLHWTLDLLATSGP